MAVYIIELELDFEVDNQETHRTSAYYYEDKDKAKRIAERMLIDLVEDPELNDDWNVPTIEDVTWLVDVATMPGWTMNARIVTLLKG